MTTSDNQTIKTILEDDLEAIKEYIETTEVSSYFLIVNASPNEYFIADNYLNNPATLIATLELALLQLKLRFAIPGLTEYLNTNLRESEYIDEIDDDLDLTDLLKSFKDDNNNSGTLQ